MGWGSSGVIGRWQNLKYTPEKYHVKMKLKHGIKSSSCIKMIFVAHIQGKDVFFYLKRDPKHYSWVVLGKLDHTKNIFYYFKL